MEDTILGIIHSHFGNQTTSQIALKRSELDKDYFSLR